jgi:hypothetical protein
MGLLAELIVRTYHESQGKPIYHIRDLKNLGEDRFVRPDLRRESITSPGKRS